MSKTRKIAIATAFALGTAALSAGPALAFGGGHGGGGMGGGGMGGGGMGGGHAGGGLAGGMAGGFGGSHAGHSVGGLGAGGDRVFTGRSVGIDRGRYGRGFYRGGRWFGYDCGPIAISEGLCPYYENDGY